MLLRCLDILLVKGEMKADEIWEIYTRAPRIPQVVLKLRKSSGHPLTICLNGIIH